MTTNRDYEAELRAALTASRMPAATIAEQQAAGALAEQIADAADAAGIDLWSRFLDIDEEIRGGLYPASA